VSDTYRDKSQAIAWVESPLQLIAAAEWASSRETPIVVALRISGQQMATTAEELLARGANFAEVIPFYGIPWSLLSAHKTWAIGDAFSGQFRMAATVLRPTSITLLDDGALTLAVADALLDRTDYARPGNTDIQLDLFLDYANNVKLYPKFHEYFRNYHPPVLAIWGKNDPFFIPAGAEAFKADIPNAQVQFLDTGHFALETHVDEIAAAMHNFLEQQHL